VLNVFRMFSRMNGERLSVESDHAVPLDAILKDGVRGKPDVAAIASLDRNKLCILVWHYHDDDLPGGAANVEMRIAGLPSVVREARQTHFRIDEEHSNAFTAWKRIGSPQSPTAEQYALLEKPASSTRLAIKSRSKSTTARSNCALSCLGKRVVGRFGVVRRSYDLAQFVGRGVTRSVLYNRPHRD